MERWTSWSYGHITFLCPVLWSVMLRPLERRYTVCSLLHGDFDREQSSILCRIRRLTVLRLKLFLGVNPVIEKRKLFLLENRSVSFEWNRIEENRSTRTGGVLAENNFLNLRWNSRRKNWFLQKHFSDVIEISWFEMNFGFPFGRNFFCDELSADFLVVVKRKNQIRVEFHRPSFQD